MPGFETLSPWDSYRYFSDPVETTISSPAVHDRVCSFNTRRVALIIGLQSAGDTIRITTKPGVDSGFGFILSGTNPPFELTQAMHGNLCQADWFFAQGTLGVVTVIEVLLNDWPETSREG